MAEQKKTSAAKKPVAKAEPKPSAKKSATSAKKAEPKPSAKKSATSVKKAEPKTAAKKPAKTEEKAPKAPVAAKATDETVVAKPESVKAEKTPKTTAPKSKKVAESKPSAKKADAPKTAAKTVKKPAALKAEKAPEAKAPEAEAEVAAVAASNEKPVEIKTPVGDAQVKVAPKGIEQAEVSVAPVRKKSKGELWTFWICIALCIVMLPLLLFNVVMIFKAAIHPNNLPSFFGIKPIIVLSGSMEPDIMTGDLIISKEIKNASDIKIGDVITFRESVSGTVVTHKLWEIAVDGEGRTIYRTYGIKANRNPDGTPIQTNELGEEVITNSDDPIYFDQIEGVYTGTRFAGLGSFIYWMQSTWGLVVCIGIPLAAFVIYELVRRNAELKAQAATANDATTELEELRKKLAAMEAEKK